MHPLPRKLGVEMTCCAYQSVINLELLVLCVQYPHVFEEEVLANIKRWVIEDTLKDVAASRASRSKSTKDADAADREMLRTYATGLLAVALGGYESACISLRRFLSSSYSLFMDAFNRSSTLLFDKFTLIDC
jgi:hypothetical protein